MFEVNVKIITELKEFLSLCADSGQKHLREHFRNASTDFTRNRKLSFSALVLFIAKLCKRTLSVELDHFFENELGRPYSCSVSAFCQQRKKLHHSFFRVWNHVLVESFLHYGKDYLRTWRGHRLIAVDGSAISLISNTELTAHFGGQRNQQCAFTVAKSLFHYDVLNRLFTHSILAPYRTPELEMAWASIDQLPPNSIAIYDRNFCNYKTIALHLWQEEPAQFVIRAKETHRFIRSFIESKEKSAVVMLYPPTKDAIIGMRKEGFIITPKTGLQVRLVRVELCTGATEVLITNLWEDQGYETKYFQELYFKRWSVETAIDLNKNKLQLESFSGLTVESVHQDFYATVVVANLASLIALQAEEELNQADQKPQNDKRKTKQKWQQKVNMNKATGRLRANLTTLFISEQPTDILEALGLYCRGKTLPVRPGRTYPRIKKNWQSNSKHKTFSNFKPAF